MGEKIELTAGDGHRLDAYLARPDGTARAGLVVCQEIFGVNDHIREVADGFAAEGFLAVAPAFFDRLERGVELAYTAEDTARGRALRTALAWESAMLDAGAAAEAARSGAGVGAVGYCWGGSLAWLAACRLDVAAAVGYYGGQIYEHRAERPGCPVMLHFGLRDPLIENAHVEEIARLHPEAAVFNYEAGHGFNCPARGDYDAEAAGLARRRTLQFLAQHLG